MTKNKNTRDKLLHKKVKGKNELIDIGDDEDNDRINKNKKQVKLKNMVYGEDDDDDGEDGKNKKSVVTTKNKKIRTDQHNNDDIQHIKEGADMKKDKNKKQVQLKKDNAKKGANVKNINNKRQVKLKENVNNEDEDDDEYSNSGEVLKKNKNKKQDHLIKNEVRKLYDSNDSNDVNFVGNGKYKNKIIVTSHNNNNNDMVTNNQNNRSSPRLKKKIFVITWNINHMMIITKMTTWIMRTRINLSNILVFLISKTII
jgi:hypothetical protein